MSSPNAFYDAVQSPIFATPAKRRHGVMSLPPPAARAPLRSPSRGIVTPVLSPVRTPTGRAGLASPQKRSAALLDQSARKRAVRSSYARLMDDEPEDELNAEDARLAEAIIRESRGAPATAYGSDVEHEEDVTEGPRRPPARRPRRGRGRAGSQKPSQDPKADPDPGPDADRDSDADDDAEADPDAAPESDADADAADSDSDSESVSLALDDDEYVRPRRGAPRASPRKRAASPRKPAAAPAAPVASPHRPLPAASASPRRKVGRPSKAAELVGKIKSIFHMDDEAFFQETALPPPRAATAAADAAAAAAADDLDLFLQTLGSCSTDVHSTAPIVSGLRDAAPRASTFTTRFEPMPIPRVDADGAIDAAFVERYLRPAGATARLADDGAIFLEGTEGYFEQHAVRSRASGHLLLQLAPALVYREFIPYVQLGQLFQERQRRALHRLHTLMYPQWCFELLQGFNLNLYGTGSKRRVLLDFMAYFYGWFEQCWGGDEPRVLVVNGYNPAVKLKQVVGEIVLVFVKEGRKEVQVPKHVLETVPFLVGYLGQRRAAQAAAAAAGGQANGTPGQGNGGSETRGQGNSGSGAAGAGASPPLVLVIHSIDGPGLRDEKTQALLAQLCLVPEIWLVLSLDNINVSLLWDLHKLKDFNFVFHDATLYDAFSTEVLFKDILSMGRSTKHAGDRGARYVLSSLTKNAKSLYRVLLTQQLAAMRTQPGSVAARNVMRGSARHAIAFKQFYQACLEEFITLNEISFRTILGEFMEHKMCTLVKDESGTEIVFVPFAYSEMEKLLEELASAS